MADLTTLQRQKDFMGITVSTNDTVLTRFIGSVSRFIENEIGYIIQQATYSNQEFDGNGESEITLTNFPITTFTTLQRRQSSRNQAIWETINSQDYHTRLSEGVVVLLRGFAEGVLNYRATYIAGYNYNLTSTFLDDVGLADLELAVWQLVRDAFNNKSKSGNIKSQSLKNYSVTYGTSSGTSGGIRQAVTPEVQATIDFYKDRILL